MMITRSSNRSISTTKSIAYINLLLQLSCQTERLVFYEQFERLYSECRLRSTTFYPSSLPVARSESILRRCLQGFSDCALLKNVTTDKSLFVERQAADENAKKESNIDATLKELFHEHRRFYMVT